MSARTGTKRSPLKKALLGLVVFLLVVALGLAGAVFVTEGQRKEDRELTIADVEFSEVLDGTYRGNYEGWNTFNVLVTVADGEVTDIEITEDSPAPATDVTDGIVERIVDGQSLDLDAVSGATVTTKAFLKAVEVALVEQQEE
jgi:uncharacterized protein with FMN-binding domain